MGLKYGLVRFGFWLLVLTIDGKIEVGNIGFLLTLNWHIPRMRFRRRDRLYRFSNW